MNFRVMTIGVIAALVMLTGCASKKRQLEDVAKDWCMTIRASQVIPVYPLTQDIQPGDVFLVQLPVDKQQLQYENRGFLPLDNHVARLDPTNYGDFYAKSFLGKQGEQQLKLPIDWMRPDNAGGKAISAWSMAPGAAFPTYSFSVNNSGGLNLAIPISGVPVGLSLLGADAANGSVTIDDARTLGVDIISLDSALRGWVDADSSRRKFLASFGPRDGGMPRNYLRVITRVYLTGKLDVSLTDAETRGGGADVGMPRPVANMLAQTPTGPEDVPQSARASYESVLAQLNKMLAQPTTPAATPGLVPGGSVRFTAASSRSVSMSETFDPPLVIGYLAFDVAIFGDGELGSAIPTHALLENDIAASESRQLVRAQVGSDGLLDGDVFTDLESVVNKDAKANELVRELNAIAQESVPASYAIYTQSRDHAGLVMQRRMMTRPAIVTHADLQSFVRNAERSAGEAMRFLAGSAQLQVLENGVIRGSASTDVDQLREDVTKLESRVRAFRNDNTYEAVALEAQRHYNRLLARGVVTKQ